MFSGLRRATHSDVASLVVTTPQEERAELRVAEGNEVLADDEGLTYSRTKHCESCEDERQVQAQVLQTRSADEPPTRQYTCRACGNR